MPAAEEELEGALEEGNLLEELVAPVRIIRETARMTGTSGSAVTSARSSASSACATAWASLAPMAAASRW